MLIGPVEAYEAAQAIVAAGEPDNGQPRQIPDPAAVWPEEAPDDWTAPLIANPEWALLPRTVETVGQDGEPQTAPEPRWQAYDAAGAIIAAASPTTLALARWRSGAPSESEAEAHAAWAQAKADALAALASEAAKPLAHDSRPDRQFSADRVKTDCGLRIYAVASDNAQKNMLATIVAGGMSDADKALFAAGVQWIAAMQAACRRMIADADPQFADDSKWPAVPAGVAELAARF